MANKNISKTRASVCVFSVILTHFSSSYFLKVNHFLELVHRQFIRPQPPELAASHWLGVYVPFFHKVVLGFRIRRRRTCQQSLASVQCLNSNYREIVSRKGRQTWQIKVF